jgi:hypothetical protein
MNNPTDDGGLIMQKNTHAMVVRSDARAMSAVTATDTRVSERWLASNADKRTFGGKPFTGTSACVSYRLDADGNKVDAKVFRAAPKDRKPNRRSVVIAETRGDVDKALMIRMGTIHENDV